MMDFLVDFFVGLCRIKYENKDFKAGLDRLRGL